MKQASEKSLWHKYVTIAVLNYKTSYHTSIGCEPSRVFHDHIPYNILDIKTAIHPQQQLIPSSPVAQDVLDQREMISQSVRKIVMQAYIKHNTYYDKKANASKLEEAEPVYVLQLKADHQKHKIPVSKIRWIGPYIIEKVLPNNNYRVRKIGINKTQVLHRMVSSHHSGNLNSSEVEEYPHSGLIS